MQKEPTKKAAGKRNAGANPPRKLSRAEKKQIAEVIRQARGDGKAHTRAADNPLPYHVPGRDLPRVGKEILKIRRL